MRNLLSGFALLLVVSVAGFSPPGAAQQAASLEAAEKGARDAAEALAAAGLGEGVSAGETTPPSPTADLAVIAHERFKLTLAVLEEEFPDDFAVLNAKINQIAAGGVDEKNAMLLVFEQLTEVRRKYAHKLLYAPTLNHAQMLGRLADFYDHVFRQEGPDVCGAFAYQGSKVLLELGLSATYAEFLDKQSATYFDAVVQSIEAPYYAGIAQPNDWGAVIGKMVEAGLPRAYVAAIGSGRSADPNLCPAYSALFRGSGVLDTPEAARIRADFAKNLTGY